MIPIVLHAVALVLYAAAAAFYGANLALRQPHHDRTARRLLLVTFVAHTAAVGSYCLLFRQSPFSSSFGTLSVAAWAVTVTYVVIEFRRRLPALGALLMPVACGLVFTAILMSRATHAVEPEIKSRLVSIHVMLVLFSFALAALAAACAIFYVWQYTVLKRPRRHSLFRRLPPLETVDTLAYHAVAFALPLLTLGLALGIIRAANGGLKGNWLLDPHTIMSLVAWLVYGTYLFARTVAGWRGTRLNYLLIAGLAVTLALYFVPSTTHRFT